MNFKMKTGKLAFLFIICCFFNIGSTKADALAERITVIEKANSQYSSGFFDHALELYFQVIESEYVSPELYYNLGNTYYKLNRIPEAILYYEKALKLLPGDENIQFNLRMANTRIIDRIEVLPELFYMRWLKALLSLRPADFWAKLSIILIFFLFGLAAISLASKSLLIRKTTFYTALLLVFLSLTTLLLAYGSYRNITSKKDAIVFEAAVAVKSAPAEKSVDLFLIHEGTKVHIIDQVGEWCEVRIASGSTGWVKYDILEII